jgi:hypothetical protein
MAASRSMLEALLARVQKRANESRAVSQVMPPLEAASADSAETLPPPRAALRDEVVEEEIEEYDDELIEIIDDADVIPQAAAAARAIEPAAFGAAFDRRPTIASIKPVAAAPRAATFPAGTSAVGTSPAATSAVATPAAVSAARLQVARAAPALEGLRAETVSPRPIAATEIARAQGSRGELRATSFLELLDASLKLGS